jgi:hypothetical protein
MSRGAFDALDPIAETNPGALHDSTRNGAAMAVGGPTITLRVFLAHLICCMAGIRWRAWYKRMESR